MGDDISAFARHRMVKKYKIDGIFLKESDRLLAVRGAQNFITLGSEHQLPHVKDCLLIIDRENTAFGLRMFPGHSRFHLYTPG